MSINIDMDYSSAAEKLCLSVIPVRGNEGILRNVPHRFIEDLAVIYRVEEGEGVSVIVNDTMLRRFGVSGEQLARDACRKAPVNHPAVLAPLSAVLGLDGDSTEEGTEDESEEVYVATTDNRFRGAAVIAYPGFLEQAADTMGGSYYVLPSSIHEVLLVSEKTGYDYTGLEELVREVNRSMVLENERLSDRVYFYDAADRTFELAVKRASVLLKNG